MCQLSRDKLHQSKGDPHKDAGVIADDALRAAMRELPEFAKRAKSRRDDHPIVQDDLLEPRLQTTEPKT
jgi:hypothetical protein